jgi:molybdopterin-guanine dinucleotide biosynthesis protein A
LSAVRLETAVVLAGGKSARMGREKALLEAGGATLIERTLAALAAGFERVAVSVAHEGPSPDLAAAIERASRSMGRSIDVYRDAAPAEGPLGAVASSLEEMEGVNAFFLAVDIPAVSLPLAAALWEEASAPGRTGCIPRWGRGLEPACAVYCKCLHPAMRRLLDAGTRELHAAAKLPGVAVLDLADPRAMRRVFGDRPPELGDVFRNLNRPEDVAGWASLPDTERP